MLEFTFNDGQKCKAGTEYGSDEESHFFDPTKKITKIETFIDTDERSILQIHFYHHEERLVMAGKEISKVMRAVFVGRKEVFEIAEDEQLIGCELEQEQ